MTADEAYADWLGHLVREASLAGVPLEKPLTDVGASLRRVHHMAENIFRSSGRLCRKVAMACGREGMLVCSRISLS